MDVERKYQFTCKCGARFISEGQYSYHMQVSKKPMCKENKMQIQSEKIDLSLEKPFLQVQESKTELEEVFQEPELLKKRKSIEGSAIQQQKVLEKSFNAYEKLSEAIVALKNKFKDLKQDYPGLEQISQRVHAIEAYANTVGSCQQSMKQQYAISQSIRKMTKIQKFLKSRLSKFFSKKLCQDKKLAAQGKELIKSLMIYHQGTDAKEVELKKFKDLKQCLTLVMGDEQALQVTKVDIEKALKEKYQDQITSQAKKITELKNQLRLRQPANNGKKKQTQLTTDQVSTQSSCKQVFYIKFAKVCTNPQPINLGTKVINQTKAQKVAAKNNNPKLEKKKKKVKPLKEKKTLQKKEVSKLTASKQVITQLQNMDLETQNKPNIAAFVDPPMAEKKKMTQKKFEAYKAFLDKKREKKLKKKSEQLEKPKNTKGPIRKKKKKVTKK